MSRYEMNNARNIAKRFTTEFAIIRKSAIISEWQINLTYSSWAAEFGTPGGAPAIRSPKSQLS
ncbi:MAG: hypothetical protein OXB92_08475 [Acidimicrobiaceae bacterium]|nr:hypothetical protein [Acidimicrobiaceae bacterium]